MNGFDADIREAAASMRERLLAECNSAKWMASAAKVAGMPDHVDKGEVIANVTLAFRHLEDAQMRLRKALQALDGGESPFDD